MGTLCEHTAPYIKTFSSIPDAPSRVASNNAAMNTREEEKAVTAAEVAAPGNSIVRAPDDQKKSDNGNLFLPAQPVRDV